MRLFLWSGSSILMSASWSYCSAECKRLMWMTGSGMPSTDTTPKTASRSNGSGRWERKRSLPIQGCRLNKSINPSFSSSDLWIMRSVPVFSSLSAELAASQWVALPSSWARTGLSVSASRRLARTLGYPDLTHVSTDWTYRLTRAMTS